MNLAPLVCTGSQHPKCKQNTKFEQIEHEHRQLLQELMSAIYEYILISSHESPEPTEPTTEKCQSNAVNSLLIHINNVLEIVFVNGLRIRKPDKSADLWRFIEGLNWINPHMTVSIGKQTINSSISVCTPKSSRIRNDIALSWLWESLLTNQLESRLNCLLSDNEHLTNCYDVTTAFLCCPKFVEALNICLKAFKHNQYEILLNIDANLYGNIDKKQNPLENDKMQDTTSIKMEPRKKAKRKRSIRMRYKLKHFLNFKLRPWASLPDIRWQTGSIESSVSWFNSLDARRHNRTQLTKENLAIKNGCEDPVTKSKPMQSLINELQPISLLKCDTIKIHTDRRHAQHDRTLSTLTFNPIGTGESNLLPFMNSMRSFNMGASTSLLTKPSVSTAPSDFTLLFATNGAKIDKPYVDDTINVDASTSPNLGSPKYLNDGCTLVPTRGQTLASYLQEAQQIRRNITDLERENAHFTLSDVIISAIEEIKCNQCDKQKQINNKQKNHNSSSKIKLWHHKQSSSTIDKKPAAIDDELSLIQSKMNICSSSTSETDLSLISTDSDMSQERCAGDLDNFKTFSISSQSINDGDHSAFAEWADTTIETLSAEGIALSLISKFKQVEMPKAVDLVQSLSDQYNEVYNMFDYSSNDKYHPSYTRGTTEWAPPRAQIIFTKHPTIDRRSLLEQQKQLCAGCGMYIDSVFAHRLRYCEYLGKLHCTGCHRSQISTIPARVLDRWDFTCHPVSVFSYRLLDRIWKVPLFRLPDLNKELYARVRSLRFSRLRRLQLKYVHDFIKTCRLADDDKAKNELDTIASYIYEDVDIWSMNDLVNVRNGSFHKRIDEIIAEGERHVFDCELCTAHGFICEYCDDKQIIFPWQTKVTRCESCGSCSHTSCTKDQCLKCQRLEKLKKKKIEIGA